MQSQVLPIGVLSHMGSLSNPHMILFIGRSSTYKYSTPLLSLIKELNLKKYTLVWFESTNAAINSSIDRQFNSSIGKISCLLPEPFAPLISTAWKIFKVCSSIVRPAYWGYLVSYLSDPIDNQSQGYEKVIAFLGANKKIDILSHSAGGRIAVDLAKLNGIRKLICFGYPFKSPNKPADKRRTDPLMTVKKPFLIIQGKYDAYGGWEVLDKYCLSNTIEFSFVESDHEYAHLENSQWEIVTQRISRFLETSTL
jgi:pimeloyl-ACP methyl ester carboxylesterase